MLKEKKNIDQLFHDKLGSYEKTPPRYLWENIQDNLDDRKKSMKFTMLKKAGIAALIVLSFLAGWMMTRLSDLPQRNKYAIENSKPSGGNKEKTEESATNLVPDSETPVNQTASSSSALKLLGAFAPSTAIVNKDLKGESPDQKEMVLFETEEEFLNSLKINTEIINKFGNWIKSLETGSIDTVKPMVIISPEDTNNSKQQFTLNGDRERDALSVMNTNKKSKWSLKAEISPLFTNAESSSNSISSRYQWDTKSENTLTGGMIASYKISDRVSFKSGISYSKLKQTTQNTSTSFASADDTYSNADILHSSASREVMNNTPLGRVQTNCGSAQLPMENLSGIISPKTITDINITQDIGYMEIPVAATYKLIDRKIDVGLSAGLSTNLLVGNSASINQNGNQIASGETAGLRDVVYSGTAGVEIGYEISDRITLTIEPRLKKFINSISDKQSINFKPYQIGVYTGLSYKFN
jgi:hypothetical protein